MNRHTALLLATVALTTPALAADPIVMLDEPVYLAPVTEADWTGFYVGVFGGATFNPATPGTIQIDQNLDGDFTQPLVAPLLGAFGTNFSGVRNGGFIGGVEIGFDKQIGQFVLGLKGDVAYVDYEDRQSGFSATPATYTEITTLNVLGTIGARAGVALGDKLLAYVHGGFAASDASTTFFSTNPNGTSRGSTSMWGYQVGAGIEGMVTEHVSLGIQYDYTNLGGRNFTTRFNNAPFAVVNAAGSDLRGTDQTFDFHAVKGTLKYRF